MRPRVLRAGVLSLAIASLLFFSSARAHEPGEIEEQPARTAPVLVERGEPVYPQLARDQGIGGTVSLEIAVGASGAVTDVKVIRGAGFGLDDAAVSAARRFKFKPATEEGKPVASTVLFDQSFTVRPRLTAEATAEPPPTALESAMTLPPTAPLSAPRRYESTVSDRGPRTSASATTIRNLDFDLRPKTSPNDILRVVPSLLAVQHQGGGKADQLFLRGFDADHGTDVGVFIDGVPVNMPSHAHGQGFADLHWLIPEAVERIDVIKGPYDPRYGDFSTAGAINLITRTDFPESSVQMTLGSFPSLGCRDFPTDCKATASQRFVGIAAPHFTGWGEKLHAFIAFEAAHDDGPFENPEKLRRYNLFAKWSYELSPSTTFGMFFQGYGSGWIGSGQLPQREVIAGRLGQFGAVDPSEGGLTERQMLTAFLHHKEADHELNVTAYVTRYTLSLWNDFTFFLEDPVNGSEIEQDDARVFSGLRMDYHFHRRWRGISFRTTMGAEGRYDGIHVDRWDATSQNGEFRKRLGRHVDTSDFAFNGNNDDIGQINVAGYIEEDVVFNRFLRVIGALRSDYFGFNVKDGGEALGAGMPNTSGTAQKAIVSPKATAVITPVPGMLDLYLNFGTGFHTNQAQVALNDGVKKTVVNGDGSQSTFTVNALPRLYGGEVGARLHLWNRIDLAGALWLSYLQNETVFDADHSAFSPSAPTRRIGLDVEARAQILSWLYLDFDLSQASATAVPDSGNGGAVALAPRLYMTGGITVKHRSGVRGGLRFRFLGDRPAFDETSPEYQYFTSKTLANGQANPDYDPSRVTAQGYIIVDAYLAYRWRFLEVALSVQNLFNSSWREAQFGNHSCTFDEAHDPMNPNHAGSGQKLADGSPVNRCGVTFPSAPMPDPNRPGMTINESRAGVTDVHFTPGIPINLQGTVKAYF